MCRWAYQAHAGVLRIKYIRDCHIWTEFHEENSPFLAFEKKTRLRTDHPTDHPKDRRTQLRILQHEDATENVFFYHIMYPNDTKDGCRT